MSDFFPAEETFDGLLTVSNGAGVRDLIEGALLDPVSEFLGRPAKRFRGQLVTLGFRISRGGGAELEGAESVRCAEAGHVLEAIHAGSLVVDDIQDGSRERRGDIALHLKHGVPLAINAGNWLYFWPFERVRRWGLPPESEVAIYRACHRALLSAHFGQALDLGVPIDALPRERIPSVVMASLELKTGALMELAVVIGGILGGGKAEAALSDFGRRFGIALQMFDDIGNVTGKGKGQDPKRLEDLRLRRPSWVWAVAAEALPNADFSDFLEAVRRLPKEEAMLTWLEGSGIVPIARAKAVSFLRHAIEGLRRECLPGQTSPAALDAVRDLGERLMASYG